MQPGFRLQDPGAQGDRGLYVIWLRVDKPVCVGVGALGEIRFPAGFYAYVGTAQRNRTARVERHLRTRKPLRWHFDYLRPYGTVTAVTYADGARDGECDLALRLRTVTQATVAHPRFGASDCRCPGHLLYLTARPDYAAIDAAIGMRTIDLKLAQDENPPDS